MKELQLRPTSNGYARVKPYSLAELAHLYEVDRKTLRGWLVPFAEKIGPRIGYLYYPAQVRGIFQCLGLPDEKPVKPKWDNGNDPTEAYETRSVLRLVG